MSAYLPKPKVTVQCDLTLSIVIPTWSPSTTDFTYGIQLSIGSTVTTIATGIPYNTSGDTVFYYSTPITTDMQYAVTVYLEGLGGYPQSTTLGASGSTAGWMYEGFDKAMQIIDCGTVIIPPTTTTSKPSTNKGKNKK